MGTLNTLFLDDWVLKKRQTLTMNPLSLYSIKITFFGLLNHALVLVSLPK